MLSLMYWHLLHSSLSGKINSKETLHCKKKCVREMTVEVGSFPGRPGCYLGNIRVFPYNRDGAIISLPLLSLLLAPVEGQELHSCI